MHPNAFTKKTCTYFLDTQVEPLTDKDERCATCSLRKGGKCLVMGSYVSADGHCSEWQ